MAYRLDAFSDVGLDEALLRLVIDEHNAGTLPRLAKLWTYFRNPSTGGLPGRRTRLAQEAGLPARITGVSAVLDDRTAQRREVVVENDIAWRIHAMVDFMFGKPLTIVSSAEDERVRRRIEAILDAVIEHSGGIALLQDAALLGHVYGHVDLALRIDPRLPDASDDHEIAELIGIEPIEPTRGIPILDPADYRNIQAYIIHHERELNAVDRRSGAWLPGRRAWCKRRTCAVTEILSGAHRQAYEDERLVEEAPNAFLPGVTPIVHIQNLAQPFRYEGLSEVEPLVPLQDELNTRLSDRACRVTMQSFKMYLAKGIEGFDQFPVAPGQVWATDNRDASVVAFGGDAASPSEEAHILEIREALDKQSGVPPLASGVVRAKIGNLTSANALRITLMGVLSKTARKRITYGRGITRLCRLILTALDTAGLLRTDPRDRGVRLNWPDPLPEDVREQVFAAQAKSDLGVPQERVLAELGYAPGDPGLTG